MRIVLEDGCGSYYDGWYIDSNGVPSLYTTCFPSAKVLGMLKFEVLWGDNPPPEELKEKILKTFQPIPVKVEKLA